MKHTLCIGLDYIGSPYELPDCHLDAAQIEKRAKASGYETHTETGILGVKKFITQMAILRDGAGRNATTLIQYSGHGTQWQSNKEPDGMQEGLCFWNGKNIEVLPDADFRAMVAQIPGTVYVFLDSCFSGGMERSAPEPRTWKKRCIPFNQSFEIVRPDPNTSQVRQTKAPTNKIYFLLACAESEVSWSTGNGGLFTKSFCAAYDRPKQKRTIKNIYNYIRDLSLDDQTPGYSIFGGNASKQIF